jgi:hypothetical protein
VQDGPDSIAIAFTERDKERRVKLKLLWTTIPTPETMIIQRQEKPSEPLPQASYRKMGSGPFVPLYNNETLGERTTSADPKRCARNQRFASSL